MGFDVLVVAEIEQRVDILIGHKYDVTAVAAGPAIGTPDPVELIPVNALATLAAISGFNVYLGFVYEHVIL